MATWDLTNTSHHLFICNGSSCNRAGAEALTQAIRQAISDEYAEDIIHTSRTLCNGRCHDQCVVIDYPSGTWYRAMTPADAPFLIQSLLEDTNYTPKVAHSFNGKGFTASEDVLKGAKRRPENVAAVSKTFDVDGYDE